MEYFIEQATSVDANSPTTFTIGMDSGQLGISGVDLRIILSARFFSTISAQGLVFSGDEEIKSLEITRNDDTVIHFIGAGSPLPDGRISLVEITATPLGPAGRGLPVAVENRGTVDAFGFEAHPDSLSLSLFLNHGPIEITSNSLRSGFVNSPYQVVLQAKGGRGALIWSLIGGSLPTGIDLQNNGVLLGTPVTQGDYNLRFRVISEDPATPAEINLLLQIQVARLNITTTHLGVVAPNQDFDVQLESIGGVAPVSWVATGLPTGLSIINDKIIGNINTDYRRFEAHRVNITAQDSDNPRQLTQKTVILNVLPILPQIHLNTGPVLALTTARDLYHTQYKLDLTTHIAQSSRDNEFDDEINRIKEEVISEIVGGRGDGPSDDFYGALDREFGIEPPRPNIDNSLWQLLQLYRELDEMQNGFAHHQANFIVRVDDIVVARQKSGALQNKTDAFKKLDIIKPNRALSFLMNLASLLLGPHIYSKIRAALDKSFAENRKRNQQSNVYRSIELQHTEEPSPPEEVIEFNRQINKKLVATNSKQIRLSSAVGLTALSLLALNETTLLTVLMLATGAIIVGGLIAVNRAQAQLLKRLKLDIATLKFDPPLIEFPSTLDDKENANEITLTPGAHHISVHWAGRMTSATRLGAAQTERAQLNYRLSVAPVNREAWQRFEREALQISGSGPFHQNAKTYEVSLPGSDIDIVLSRDANEPMKLLAAMGQGQYYPEFDFPESWPDDRIYSAPKTDFLQSAILDEYGRSSVISASQGRINIVANRVGGFSPRIVFPENMDNKCVDALVCTDIDHNGWKHIYAAMGNKIIHIEGIKPDPTDSTLVTALIMSEFSAGATLSANAPIADLCNGPSLEVSSNRLGLSIQDSIVMVYRYEDVIRLFNTETNQISSYTEFDENPITSQPSSVLITGRLNENGNRELILALWQERKILRWSLSGRSPILIEEISLPLRPKTICKAPGLLTGICAIGDGSVMHVEMEDDNIEIRPIFAGFRDLRTARSDIFSIYASDDLFIFNTLL